MKATIVLPNLNGAGWLRPCVESLYTQTEQSFELIIVDNGSSDESLADARAFAAARENCALIENKENTGFSAAVNQGIRAAKAPYVLLFNNDAFAKPDMLSRLLAAMEADGRVFSAQALMLRHREPEKADDAGDYMTILGWACKRGDGLPAARYQKQRRIFAACGGAALYRKEMLDKIGLFDEHFFAYLEDVDIGWRANNAGYRNVLVPDAVCTHICGATTSGESGAKYNDFKSVQSGRNNILLPYKNMPLVMLVLNIPFLLVGYLVKTLFFALRGFGRPWRQGAREAFAALGKLEKPKFRIKKLPCYFWVQGSMIAGMFVYIDYRVRRLFTR